MSVKDELNYPEELDAIMRNEITVWRDFHLYWLHKSQDTSLPVYFCRYEDLISSPLAELEAIFKFLLDTDTLEGTYVQRRIRQVVAD